MKDGKAQQLSNQWVKLTIVPQLGGRIMQVVFGDHAYLFVNQKVKGKYSSPDEAATRGQWLNYGGDKLWPLPEGTQDKQHWPGPISDALDAGAHELGMSSAAPVCKIALQGSPDRQPGLQYSREISLRNDSPEISFHAVMKNATAYNSLVDVVTDCGQLGARSIDTGPLQPLPINKPSRLRQEQDISQGNLSPANQHDP